MELTFIDVRYNKASGFVLDWLLKKKKEKESIMSKTGEGNQRVVSKTGSGPVRVSADSLGKGVIILPLRLDLRASE